MPLTTRTNGSGGSNIIQAAWFNDFLNLFTGVMQDQEVVFKNNLVIQGIGTAPGSAPTLALAAGTALGIGVYKYEVTFVSPDGETLAGPSATITTTTGNQAVNLTAIATGPTGTTARKVYRTSVGGSAFLLDATLSDNTTTTLSDTVTDATLTTGGGTPVPTHPSFGGSLVIKNSAGAVFGRLNNDGSLSLDVGKLLSDGAGNFTLNTLLAAMSPLSYNGTTSGTATLWQPMAGSALKLVMVFHNNLRNGTASIQSFTLPTAFTTGFMWFSTGMPAVSFMSVGSAQTADSVTALASGGGTDGTTTTPSNYGFGGVNHAVDTIQYSVSNSTAHTGWLLLIGS